MAAKKKIKSIQELERGDCGWLIDQNDNRVYRVMFIYGDILVDLSDGDCWSEVQADNKLSSYRVELFDRVELVQDGSGDGQCTDELDSWKRKYGMGAVNDID